MADSNGNVKWYQLVISFIALLGILVTSGWAFGGYVFRADDRLEAKIDKTTECFQAISIQLARIEQQLGINVQ